MFSSNLAGVDHDLKVDAEGVYKVPLSTFDLPSFSRTQFIKVD